jgi:hypothetical protein
VGLWLIGALTAVASVIVAGAQLTTLGQLEFSEWRFWVALAAVGVALAATGWAIKICVLLQMPGLASVATVQDEAADPGSELSKEIVKQGIFTDGASASAWLAEYTNWQTRQREIIQALSEREDKTAREELDELKKKISGRRPVVNRMQRMAGYFALKREFTSSQKKLLLAAAVAAISFAFFAWAANPSADEEASKRSVPDKPVAATLRLNEEGRLTLESALGEACARLAKNAENGIPVIALSSDEDSVEVVTQRQGECQTVLVRVDTSLGTVVGEQPVKLPAPSPNNG